MKASRGDEVERLLGARDLRRVGHFEQRMQVDGVLGPALVVTTLLHVGFHEGDGLEPRMSQIPDEGLGVRVRVHGHGQIDVACEARLGAHRDSEAAYEGEAFPSLSEEPCDPLENGGEAGHRGVPGASPCSAPGRVDNHATSLSSICSALSKGCRRRRFCRIKSSPAS